MTLSKELAAVSDGTDALSVDAVVAQQKRVTDVMMKVMKRDHHYGIVPGCQKPSLWKPGAEVLCVTFRLAPSFTTSETYDGKHLTVRSVCTLTHIPTGRVFASAPALCSTKEKKYRLRKEGGRIVENANLEDSWNTVSKMADKRALVAAVLLATGASDAFTQDMGEDEEKNEEKNAIEKEPLVVVDTEAVVKENKEAAKSDLPPAEPEKRSDPAPLQKVKKSDVLTWAGVIDRTDRLELPNGKPAWAFTGKDGQVFKTDQEDIASVAMQLVGEVEIAYHLNPKKTQVMDAILAKEVA